MTMKTTTMLAAGRTAKLTKLTWASSTRALAGAMMLTLAAANIGPAQAQSTPLFTPASFNDYPQNGAFTMGFAFTVGSATFLNALGAYDYRQDGFPAPMTVGLWTNSGTLLQQATVTSTDQLIGSFRYASLPSYALTAGTTYVVGAFRYSGDGGEVYATGNGGTAAPGISFVEARLSDSGSFAFPNQVVGTYGYFGANALVGDQIVVGQPGGAVPEPATWAMMIAGFGTIGASLRRRRTIAGQMSIA